MRQSCRLRYGGTAWLAETAAEFRPRARLRLDESCEGRSENSSQFGNEILTSTTTHRWTTISLPALSRYAGAEIEPRPHITLDGAGYRLKGGVTSVSVQRHAATSPFADAEHLVGTKLAHTEARREP